MKNNKKIITIIISIVLIISITSAVLIATANAKETSVVISVDKEELSAGETATVSVKVTANYSIATMSIPVFYDKTLVEVTEATATLTDFSVASAITDEESADTNKIYVNTDISEDNFGFVLVNYIGGAGKDVPETMDSVVLTFKITAKADVNGTAAIKCDNKSAKTDDNVAGMLYFGSPTSGRTINSIPENIENIDLTSAQSNVTIITGGTTLLPNKELTAVVDTEKNYVYGIPAGIGEEDLGEYFTVSNGIFKMVANEGGYTTGTGATLVVKDLDGNEVASYTLIIFGDVNGDGAVTATDSATVEVASLGAEMETAVYVYAADVNGDGAVTATDSATVEVASLGGEITVNPYN